MELMGIVGVMVNCALIGQSGQVHRMFPNITGTQTVLLIIILEVSFLSVPNREYCQGIHVGFENLLFCLP